MFARTQWTYLALVKRLGHSLEFLRNVVDHGTDIAHEEI